ncbi:MAG: T9SS type A sorting domain-containing protein [Flavobacteriales bacterium]|nr:T9SS type A sorting domain-containing protein [Flavobacteriales bacterium]
MAQITTAGELTLELNVELECGGALVRIVARDTLLASDETANGLLVYPPQCGCTDPYFLEYDPAAGCDDGSCATAIVFGCLDIDACNYDPAANFNVPQLCCYGPSDCNGLDITVVCPDVGVSGTSEEFSISIGPNPAHGSVNILYTTGNSVRLRGTLRDALGRRSRDLGRIRGSGALALDFAHLPVGLYHLLLDMDGSVLHRRLIIE